MNIKLLAGTALRFFQGIAVGFGAILPGISGGTLCVAFGMYLPIISVLSDPKRNLKIHGASLSVFLLGAAVGFIGLSGLAGYLMRVCGVLTECVFAGFIIGTFPKLWSDAGKKRHGSRYIFLMTAGFAAMLLLLKLLGTRDAFHIDSGFTGFLLCGALWGLSFILPGLSSSTLLMFFGLYAPMLDGIAALDAGVLIPVAAGGLICVASLSKIVGKTYELHFSAISHIIIGVVASTVVMILPIPEQGDRLLPRLMCIMGGCAVSYMFTRLCTRLDASNV